MFQDADRAYKDTERAKERASPDSPGAEEFDAATRGRLERSLGEKLPAIRVHPEAGEGLVPASARAVTLGNEIAFGRGEYRPGTLAGEMLIAHEVAHSLDQQGTGAPVANQVAEQQANRVAITAALGLPGAGPVRNRGGVTLRRCDKSPSTTKDAGAPVPAKTLADAGTVVDPRDALKKMIEAQAATGSAGPPDWANLRQFAVSSKMSSFQVSGVCQDAGFVGSDADAVAYLAVSDKSYWRALAGHYSSEITPAPNRSLKSNLLWALTSDVLASGSVSADGADALRDAGLSYGWDMLTTALVITGVPPATVTTLIATMNQGQTAFRTYIRNPDLFPMPVAAPAKGAKPSDPRVLLIRVLLGEGTWSQGQRTGLRTLLKNESWTNAKGLLIAAGLDDESATTVATSFMRTEVEYSHWTEQQRLIWSFQKTGAAWHLSSETKAQLALPTHPVLPGPLAPYSGSVKRAEMGSVSKIGQYKFASGQTQDADQLVLTLAGHNFTIIATEGRLTSDATLFDRLEDALATVPVAHLNLVKTLVFDPGDDPFAAANANKDGKVNIFLSGAAPAQPVAWLREMVTHEVGHLVSFAAEATMPGFWTQWDAAIAADKADPSRYALTNHLEDFAESYVVYMASKGHDPGTRARYSHRFAILDTLWPK